MLIKFRIGVSEINTHRHKFSKDTMLKQCPFCVRHFLEDEIHVLFYCPLYDNLRAKYLKDIDPKILNCQISFQSFMKTQWYIIAKYLYDMFQLRKNALSLRLKWQIAILFFKIITIVLLYTMCQNDYIPVFHFPY